VLDCNTFVIILFYHCTSNTMGCPLPKWSIQVYKNSEDLWFITSQLLSAVTYQNITGKAINSYFCVYTIQSPTEYYFHIIRCIAGVGTVVWLPRQQSPRGRKMNILNYLYIYIYIYKDCLWWTYFKLLGQVQGNSINICDFFLICNFCQGRQLLLFTSKSLAPPLRVLDYNPGSAPRLTSTDSKYSLLHLPFIKFIYNWNVMLYSLVHRYEHFKWPCHLHFQAGDALNVAAAGSSETLLSTYQTVQHHILEDKYS
jgi:hypothetical protein